MDEAKDCFIRAYNLNRNEESLIEYFCVLAVTVDTATLEKRNQKTRTSGKLSGGFNDGNRGFQRGCPGTADL